MWRIYLLMLYCKILYINNYLKYVDIYTLYHESIYISNLHYNKYSCTQTKYFENSAICEHKQELKKFILCVYFVHISRHDKQIVNETWWIHIRILLHAEYSIHMVKTIHAHVIMICNIYWTMLKFWYNIGVSCKVLTTQIYIYIYIHLQTKTVPINRNVQLCGNTFSQPDQVDFEQGINITQWHQCSSTFYLWSIWCRKKYTNQ